MEPVTMATQIEQSALLIVDMQNDFVHPDGAIGRRAREVAGLDLDLQLLRATIPNIRRLADAFREAGRPVVSIAHVLKPDYSDAQFPYWRRKLPAIVSRTFIVEGSWGAQIISELAPPASEHVVVKKGFSGFSNTPLDTILRNLGVTTCVVVGVTTCVCVSSTVRDGAEHNYSMVVVRDAVAELNRNDHEAELRVLGRIFADLKTTDEVIAVLGAVGRDVSNQPVASRDYAQP
jgi:ureidoacrylate peracid hydrolase